MWKISVNMGLNETLVTISITTLAQSNHASLAHSGILIAQSVVELFIANRKCHKGYVLEGPQISPHFPMESLTLDVLLVKIVFEIKTVTP